VASRPRRRGGAGWRQAGQFVRTARRHLVLKGGREVQYGHKLNLDGHKLNLATGKSGLILDLVVEAGNPADAERFLPMLDRHIARYGVPPRQTAADGGYASLGNLQQAKARGVQDVAFHKKRGIAIDDMVKKPLGFGPTTSACLLPPAKRFL
jgi:IS5 family transposase